MSAFQRKSKKEQQTSESEVPETIEIPLPQPKKKGSSKQEPVPVVVDIVDDSTPSVAVEPKPSKKEKSSSKQKEQDIVDDDSTPSEPKPSKKGKKSAPKSNEDEQVISDEVEPAPKKGKSKKVESGDEGEGEGEFVEKSKKQPPKSLGEQMTDSVETLAIQSEKLKVLIELKEALLKHLKHLPILISSRKKELKKQKEDESEDAILQFLEKQKESLKDEITILKSSIRELASVSKVIEKATKQLDSKKKDPSKPKKTKTPIFVAVSTDSMDEFIKENLNLITNDGNKIFKQTPERNSDGRFLVERTQLMQLINAYIRDKSLRKDGFIELDAQLKPLFHTYLEGDFSRKVDSKSVFCIPSHHLEKKA
jgi:hypothetical protein